MKYCRELRKILLNETGPFVFLIDRCCEQTPLSLGIDSTATRTKALQTCDYVGDMINLDFILPGNYMKLRYKEFVNWAGYQTQQHLVVALIFVAQTFQQFCSMH